MLAQIPDGPAAWGELSFWRLPSSNAPRHELRGELSSLAPCFRRTLRVTSCSAFSPVGSSTSPVRSRKGRTAGPVRPFARKHCREPVGYARIC